MYYDFGKLWHSVNGKYEMVANEMWDLDGSNYSLHKNKYFYFLESLKEILPEEIFFKYINPSFVLVGNIGIII